MADPVFAEAVSSATNYDQSKLKYVETKEKNVLPSKEVLNQEKKHQEFLSSLNQDNTQCLRPLLDEEKIKSKVSGDKTHQNLVSEIAQSAENKDKLRPTMTKEKVDSMKSDKNHEKFVKGIEGYEKGALHHVQPEEKISLPDADTVKEVKKYENLMSSIQHKDVDLRPTMTRDKADSLAKEDAQKRLSSQIKHAQETKDNMRHIVTADRVHGLAKDQTHQQLVSEIAHSAENKDKLRPTMTKEKVDCLKEDATHQDLVKGVTGHKRELLNHVDPNEKVVLPDKETVEEVRKQENLLKSIQAEENKDKLRPTMTRDRAESLSKQKEHQDLTKKKKVPTATLR